jgi:hypothetical protein
MAATDVLYQDDDICILRPDAKRGVLIHYLGFRTNICEDGLLTWNEARKRFTNIPTRDNFMDQNDFIKFRAPFTSNLTNFKTSYKAEPRALLGKDPERVIVIIRIDPAKSFVYSSEARTHLDKKAFLQSRIPFNEYIKRIDGFESRKLDANSDICSNIVTYESKIVKNTHKHLCFYPWIKYLPIQRNAEIIAHIPNIPPTWFVNCLVNRVRRPNNKTLKVQRQR